MKHETHCQRNFCPPTKGIVMIIRSFFLPRPCPLFFQKVCQIGRRRVTEALGFFQNAFQQDSRLLRAVTLWAGNNNTGGRVGGRKEPGDEMHDRNDPQLPLPFRTHNAPRAAQGKFSGRHENRCFIRLHRGVHARLEIPRT